MSVANNLVRSMFEAGSILRGEIVSFEAWSEPAGRKQNKTKTLAIFVGDDESLVTGKIYPISVLRSGTVLVKDEEGESVICDKTDFLVVKFQPKAEKLIHQLVTA